MYEDKIYHDFHMFGDHFTVEDYGDGGYALYHEDMFVAELKTADISEAYAAAQDYGFACRR